MITQLGNLAMGRQGRIQYAGQNPVKAIQQPCMGEHPGKIILLSRAPTRGAVLQQFLNARGFDVGGPLSGLA